MKARIVKLGLVLLVPVMLAVFIGCGKGVTDTTAPTVLVTSPTSEASGIAMNTAITALFSKDMDSGSITTNTFFVTSATGEGVGGTVSYANKTASFTPASNLQANTRYTVSILGTVRDAGQSAMGTNKVWSFTTSATTAPSVESTVPVNGSSGIAVNTAIVATFSRAMTSSTITTSTFTIADSSGTAVTGVVTYDAAAYRAIFTPSSNLTGGRVYTAIITTGVKDASGVAMANLKSWSFTTISTTAPTVASIVPADGATGVNRNGTTVRITFDKDMDAATINTSSIKVGSTAEVVSGEVSYNAASRTATFTPAHYFNYGITYVVTVESTVADTDGNTLGARQRYSFATPTISFSAGRIDTAGFYTSIGIDSNDKVSISYYDTINEDLKYITNASGGWAATTIDSAGKVGEYDSIGIDSNDNVHIIYYDAAATHKYLKYATKANGSNIWVINVIDDAVRVGEDYGSIGIDLNNNVHISYYDLINGNLKYATKANGSNIWNITTIDSAGDVGAGSSIGIDSNNNVHISYYDSTNRNLKYATKANGSNLWDVTTIDSAGDVGEYSSIGIDLNNNVHISYYDSTNRNLKYATKANGSNLWDVTTIDSAGDVGLYSSIGIDLNNKVHIIYYDADHDNLKYATNANGNMSLFNVDSVQDSGGYDPSMRIDANGKIHVSYGAASGNYLKYAVSQ